MKPLPWYDILLRPFYLIVDTIDRFVANRWPKYKSKRIWSMFIEYRQKGDHEWNAELFRNLTKYYEEEE